MVAGPARPSALRRLAAQLATLLWKNMLLKRRRWKATVAEIVLPLAVFAVAVWARTKVPLDPTPAGSQEPKALPSAGLASFAQGFFCQGNALSATDYGDAASIRPSILEEVFGQLAQSNISLSLLSEVAQTMDANWDETATYFSWVNPATLTRLHHCVGVWGNTSVALGEAAWPDGLELNADAMIERATSQYQLLSDALECLNQVLPLPVPPTSTLPWPTGIPKPPELQNVTVWEELLAELAVLLFEERLPLTAAQVQVLYQAAQTFSAFAKQHPFNSRDVQTFDQHMFYFFGAYICPRNSSDEPMIQFSGSYDVAQVAQLIFGRYNYAPKSADVERVMGLLNRTFQQMGLFIRSIFTFYSLSTADVHTSGDRGVLHELWFLNGSTSITTSTVRPARPADRAYAWSGMYYNDKDLSTIHNVAYIGGYENVFHRLSGILTPSAAGNVSFLLANASLAAELWLDNTRIVHTGWGNIGQYVWSASQYLEAGRVYNLTFLAHSTRATWRFSPTTVTWYRSCPVGAESGCMQPDTDGLRLSTPLWQNSTSAVLASQPALAPNALSFERFVGYATEWKAVNATMGIENMLHFPAAIIFNNVAADGTLPAHVQYSIRKDPRMATPSTFDKGRHPLITSWGNQEWRYLHRGFVALQDLLDRSIIWLQAGRTVVYPPTYTQAMPHPYFESSGFSFAIGQVMPLLMVLAWIYAVSLTVKSLVYEKEHRLREAMRMMGLPTWVHWLSWGITSLLTITASAVLMTVMLSAGHIFENSSPFLLFLFLELFAVSTIALSFLVSVFFSKAKLAAACAGLIYFAAYLPFILLTQFEENMTGLDKFFTCLLSPAAFGLGCRYISFWEQQGPGLQLQNAYLGAGECDNFTFSLVCACLILDSIVYVLLACYIDNVFPGEFGVPRPALYFLRKSFWCSSASAHNAPTHSSPTRGIVATNLTKQYDSSRLSCWAKPLPPALDRINLDLRGGDITALLGHNGAGKTTFMSILTGLFPPTSGSLEVDGLSVRSDMDAIRTNLGLCPQYNVLFEWLTVDEHLRFCSRLRGVDKEVVAKSIAELLTALNLQEKQHTLAKDLSGGMKRKLSVAMAYVGNPATVILDEPTAGMDPSARRLTWDLILKHREDHTVLLSTHHMDEADLLSDRVAFISSGRIRAVGSPMELKQKYGAGYTLTMHLHPNATRPAILARIAEFVPDARVQDDNIQDLAVVLPAQHVHSFKDLFAALEAGVTQYGIEDYGIQATSLEEVFLNVVEKADADDKRKARLQSLKLPSDGRHGLRVKLKRHKSLSMQNLISDGSFEDVLDEEDVQLLSADSDDELFDLRDDDSDFEAGDEALDNKGAGAYDNSQKPALATTQDDLWDPAARANYHQGGRLFLRRVRAMVTKRALYARRDRKAFFSQIVLPVIFILLAMLVATAFPPQVDQPKLEVSASALYDQGCAGASGDTVFFGSNDAIREVQALVRATVDSAATPFTKFINASFGNLTAFLLDTRADLDATIHGGFSVDLTNRSSLSEALQGGGLSNASRQIIRAWYDSRDRHSLPAFINLANNGILRNAAGPGYRITTYNWPVNYTLDLAAERYLKSATDLVVSIFTIIALSFVPASFVVFLVHERINKSKHLQFSSGVTPLTYWLGNFIWDYAAYLLSASCALIIFVAFGLPSYTGRNLSTIVTLLYAYGFAIIPAMYPACFVFEVPSTAYVALIIFNLFVGLTCTLTTSILDIFAKNAPDLAATGDVLKIVFLIFPNYCLGRGILDTARNEYTAQAHEISAALSDAIQPGADANSAGFQSPLAWDVVGRNILCLLVEGSVFFLATIVYDYYRLYYRKHAVPAADTAQRDAALNSDVAAERLRVMAKEPLPGTSAPDIVRVERVVKDYSLKHVGWGQVRKKQAVRGVTFGVAPGECFGLLGVNGAGKTTTFQILTGDLMPTSGVASIAGFDLRTQINQARQRFGYCPQFDALCDLLSGRELLTMYARVRGVPEDRVVSLVAKLLQHMQLERWQDRVTKSYSGGMDPRARRFLWRQIEQVRRAGRCIVLTSHSMGECEALCTRLVIMVNGQFKCIGSPQYLRSRYGDGYTLLIKTCGEVEQVKQFIERSFLQARLEEVHRGYLHYQLPRGSVVSLSSAFGLMEQAKAVTGIENYELSQTSLEEVFCKFAREQHSDAEKRVAKTKISFAFVARLRHAWRAFQSDSASVVQNVQVYDNAPEDCPLLLLEDNEQQTDEDL